MTNQKIYKVLCVGPQWRGSNAGALFRAFSKLGHIIHILDENYYINFSSQSFLPKAIDKFFRPFYLKEFNLAILKQAELFKPDFFLVFKGAFLLPETLDTLNKKGIVTLNFYPDVSFTVHSSLLPKTLPLYKHVFSTKTFGIKDMKEKLNINSSSFIPHGFDTDLHYPRELQNIDTSVFKCDTSFIGDYDSKKENILREVIRQSKNTTIKIWGKPWINSKDPLIQDKVMGNSIFGDLYPIGIQSSKINLGLLSEIRPGASSGDLITSRTFHIPACGGFMIHERNDEVLNYYEEGKEIECFASNEELNSKIHFYLNNESQREQIRLKGYERTIAQHSLVHRASEMIKTMKDLN